MNTTAGSTATDDRDRSRREGSVLWAKTKPLLDELVQLRAEKAQQQPLVQLMVQAKQQRAKQRRQALVAAVESICQAQDDDRPLAGMTSSQRVDVVLGRLENTPEKYGLPKGWKKSDRKERVVRSVLKSWFTT